MSIKILMPALSPTMTEGNIAKWLKKEGDKVVSGDVIAEIETDKATMEVDSPDDGVFYKIIIPQGTQNVPVNTIIAVLLEEGESPDVVDRDIANYHKANPSESVQITKDDTTKKKETFQQIVVEGDVTNSIRLKEGAKETNIANINKTTYSNVQDSTSVNSRIFASPLAKRLAVLNDIDLYNIKGSGPHGRIIKKDVVLPLMQNVKHNRIIDRNNEEFRVVENNNIRKIIAKRLVESKNTIPHFYLSIECNVDKLLDIREDVNNNFSKDKGIKISLNDFIILAAAFALREVPEANASWDESQIRYYNNIDISVAVSIDSGLITPIIKNADKKNIRELSAEMKNLIKKARENKLLPEEFQGGGFSISNLGMYGIKSFNAIINPPQSCILAIGASSRQTIVNNNDQIKIATIMNVTLSADHRVVDGVVGAKFLASFKKFIESPILMFI